MQKLIDAGVLKKQIEKEVTTPWFANFFIIFVSFIGGICLIALLGAMGILDEDNAHIFGAICMGTALYFHLANKADNNINSHHFLLVILIAGEIGLAIGFYGLSGKKFTLILMALIQIPLFFIINNYLQRVLNILIFTLSILFFSNSDLVSTLFIVSYFASIIYLTLYEKKFFDQSWLYQLKDASIITIFVVIIIKITQYHNTDRVMLLILAGILALYTKSQLFIIYKIKNYFLYLISIVLITLFYPTPELVITLTILVLSLYQKNYFFIFLSIVVTIFFIGFWYYNTTFSLLYKSISMMLIGVLLLSIYYARSKYAKNSNISNLFTF